MWNWHYFLFTCLGEFTVMPWSFLCGKVFNYKSNLCNRHRDFQVNLSPSVSFDSLCPSVNLIIYLSCQNYWHTGSQYSFIILLMFLGPILISLLLLLFQILVICVFSFFLDLSSGLSTLWIFSKNQLLVSMIFLLVFYLIDYHS